jgi:Flp pilus assembly pilin Flp
MAVAAVARAIVVVRARSDVSGQGLVEYGLILVGSALFAIVLLVFFGGTLSAVLEAIGEAIERAS